MQGCEWVIDTTVLGIAQDARDERALDGLAFLWEILHRHYITLDTEGKIEAEFRRNLRPGTHASAWWGKMISRAGRITWRAGSLGQRHKDYLLNRLGFHDDDLKFVAVASKGKDKFLVSEDSDYNDKVKKYLSATLQVQVFSIREALTKARDC